LAKYIEKTANICYHFNMKYFENNLTYNQISFSIANTPDIKEREMHLYHEILFFIDGNAKLLTKNIQKKLTNHSLIIIPEETYHFFEVKYPETFTRLKISFTSKILENTPVVRLMSHLRIIEKPGENVRNLLEKLCNILKQKGTHAGFYAYSAFLMLICELNSLCEGEDAFRLFATNHSSMRAIMEYINDNLSSELNIKSLSEKFHISPSGITHLFKKNFGISLHKFITQKRLVYARKLIMDGGQASKVYADVGFMDYSSFYKAYTKFFGYSPSKDKGEKTC